MTKSQAKALYERNISGDILYQGKDIYIRPFLSKKAYVIGPRGKVTVIWYKSHTSSVVEVIR